MDHGCGDLSQIGLAEKQCLHNRRTTSLPSRAHEIKPNYPSTARSCLYDSEITRLGQSCGAASFCRPCESTAGGAQELLPRQSRSNAFLRRCVWVCLHGRSSELWHQATRWMCQRPSKLAAALSDRRSRRRQARTWRTRPDPRRNCPTWRWKGRARMKRYSQTITMVVEKYLCSSR